MFVYKRGTPSFRCVSSCEKCSLPTEPFLRPLYRNNADLRTTDGRKERVQFDKITARVSRLCYGLDAGHVDAAAITQKVISGVYQGVTTIELDNLVRHSSVACKTQILIR